MTEPKIGKYTIVGEIGRGAMGIVYKAIDPFIGRTVAVKTIRFDILGQGPERDIAQKRFMREAHSAGNLSHPNIVTIYEVGEDQGISYIAMEYVDGSSLEDLMHARQKFSLEEILSLVEHVAEGLEMAHKKGVVHRDIKPANILIDSENRPRIVDFGIARISTSTMTQTNMIMGTPYYMSPEQISGRKVDNRADIFALGGILYELLTGQKAFPGDNLTTVIYRIINEEPLPIRTVKKNLPEGLDFIVSKALAKAPEERYQNCRELVHDLRHYTQLKAPAPAFAPSAEVAEAPAARPIVREPRPTAKPEGRRRSVVIVLAAMLAVTAVVIGLIILFPKGTENPGVVSGPPNPNPGPGPAAPSSSSSTPDDLYQRGRQLWGEQKYPEALAALEQVPESAPQYFEARLGVASIWETQDRLGAAAGEYRKLVDLNPKDGRPVLHLAELDERRGDRTAALANYRKFVTISPDGAEAEGIRWKIKTLESQVSPPVSTPPATASGQAGQSPAPGAAKPVQDKPKPPAVQPPAAAKPVDIKPADNTGEREADIAQMVEVGKKSLDKKNYAQAVQQLKSVLALDPGNKDAKYYLAVAEAKFLDETKKATIKQDLEQARTALRSEDYAEAVIQSRRALALDSELGEAKKIINSAVVKAAPAEMKALLDQYLAAVKRGELRNFYSQQCTPGLFQKIKKEAEIISAAYQNIQASAAGLDVSLKDTKFDNYKSEAAFTQVMTGVSREKGTRQILFEGKMRWTLINLGSGWRISEITALAKNKK
jgi:serine/threonine protein kinase/tetratricopeptide (TPR) repeat protein